MIGNDFSDYFTDPAHARQVHEKVLAVESVTNHPLTIRHRDGHLVDVLYNSTVYRDADGAVLGVFAAARDMTAQKQAEANFRGLVEGAPDAIVVVDGNGVIRRRAPSRTAPARPASAGCLRRVVQPSLQDDPSEPRRYRW